LSAGKNVVITVLTGDNSFEIEHFIKATIVTFDGASEHIDGTTLEMRHLPDIFMGVSLFSEKRLIFIKNLSENSNIWSTLEEWIMRVSDDTMITLIEPSLDKRTKIYKTLQKYADIKEFKAWTDRDISIAEKWIEAEAKTRGISLVKKDIQLLVRRVGVDQWLLFQALEKLAVFEEVTSNLIEDIVDSNPTENVFNLFEAALKGDISKVQSMIAILVRTEDPYRLFGLLSGQVVQLAALTVASGEDNVAKDFSVHPYALSKLSSFAKQLGKSKTKKAIIAFAEADTDMKTSASDPWFLIERALLIVATLK
jgi:DNA polymerase III subunit delta